MTDGRVRPGMTGIEIPRMEAAKKSVAGIAFFPSYKNYKPFLQD